MGQYLKNSGVAFSPELIEHMEGMIKHASDNFVRPRASFTQQKKKPSFYKPTTQAPPPQPIAPGAEAQTQEVAPEASPIEVAQPSAGEIGEVTENTSKEVALAQLPDNSTSPVSPLAPDSTPPTDLNPSAPPTLVRKKSVPDNLAPIVVGEEGGHYGGFGFGKEKSEVDAIDEPQFALTSFPAPSVVSLATASSVMCVATLGSPHDFKAGVCLHCGEQSEAVVLSESSDQQAAGAVSFPQSPPPALVLQL